MQTRETLVYIKRKKGMSTGPGSAACLQDARARSNTRGCITMGAACVGRYTAVPCVVCVGFGLGE